MLMQPILAIDHANAYVFKPIVIERTALVSEIGSIVWLYSTSLGLDTSCEPNHSLA